MKIKLDIQRKYKQIQGVIDFGNARTLLLKGNNGTGKSTCLDYIKQNTLNIFEKTTVAYCSQSPQPALPGFTVQHLLNLSLEFSRDKNVTQNLQNDLIHMFEFKDKLKTEIRQLSGGENQLLKLITTLCLNADFYFLDEPFQFLDESKSTALMNYLIKLKSHKKLFIIEHKTHWPSDFFDKTYILKSQTEFQTEIYEL
ncbi:MAG: ATP-binding cassette domain-containing protein [Bacteriovoracaceae bacterium]|nr:ATP-binding cassette domain-containing protein [Bacteriovoracaceae bacterium]